MKGAAVTVERIERGMDRLAEIIVERGEDGKELLPIYRRLEEALAAEREAEQMLSAIAERAKRAAENGPGAPH